MAIITWSLRRQIIYTIILVGFVSILAYSIIAPSLNRPPTCADNKQNGNETGVDCGGTCARACMSQVEAVSVLWARAFRVIPGRYNAVAYLVNHNKNAAVEKIITGFVLPTPIMFTSASAREALLFRREAILRFSNPASISGIPFLLLFLLNLRRYPTGYRYRKTRLTS